MMMQRRKKQKSGMRNTKWESRRWVWVLVKTPWKTSWEDSIWNFSLQTISNVCKIRMIKRIPTNLDSLLKSRDITLPTKGHLVKAMVFPVVTWELNYKESWVLKNWCFWTVVLEKTLESPWTARRYNQSILKEINSEYLSEGLMPWN